MRGAFIHHCRRGYKLSRLRPPLGSSMNVRGLRGGDDFTAANISVRYSIIRLKEVSYIWKLNRTNEVSAPKLAPELYVELAQCMLQHCDVQSCKTVTLEQFHTSRVDGQLVALDPYVESPCIRVGCKSEGCLCGKHPSQLGPSVRSSERGREDKGAYRGCSLDFR